MMKLYDISMMIDEDMAVYKNKQEKKPVFVNRSNFETGNHYETSITMDLHTGTHIDAPLHMIKEGAKMESYRLDEFITPVKVLNLTNIEHMITRQDLINHEINKGDFILFKTRNSYRDDFDFDFVYLEKSGAQYLKESEVKGVGIDALGIERDQPQHDTHKILLENNMMILEGIRLREVPEGDYQLIALPLKIMHTEAAPTRAVLIEIINNENK